MTTSQVNEAVRKTAKKAVLCWLATSDKDGFPNVSPKEVWEVSERGQVVIAEIASATSMENVRENPNVCVAFLDLFAQKGFQLYGKAELLQRGSPSFDEIGDRLLKLAELGMLK